VENADEKVLESLRQLYKAVGTEARPHIAAIANRFKAQGTFRRRDFDRLTTSFARYQIPYQPDKFSLKILTASISAENLLVFKCPQRSRFSNLVRDMSTDGKKAENLCETCGGCGPQYPVECHEIWNYDDTRLIQKLDGLIALCPDCHEVKHIGLAGARLSRFNSTLVQLKEYLNSRLRPRRLRFNSTLVQLKG